VTAGKLVYPYLFLGRVHALMEGGSMRRRECRRKGTVTAGRAAPHKTLRPQARSEEVTKLAPIAQRPLGKNGEHLSIIGMGGIVLMNVKQPRANNLVAEAFDRGINVL
jgi:hypothetical protein